MYQEKKEVEDLPSLNIYMDISIRGLMDKIKNCKDKLISDQKLHRQHKDQEKNNIHTVVFLPISV